MFSTPDRPASSDGLHADSVSVRYGRHPIITDVSFTVDAGRFHTVIGPNGSGKSTLLRALTGEVAFSGDVRLNAISIATARPEQLARVRGVLPQHTALSFPLTVAEVVGLGLLAQQHAGAPAWRRAQTAAALDLVDLAGFEGRTYQDLSGGEQQRVQLARVLCQVWEPVLPGEPPRWLFLDEPVSSLDIKHQIQIMQIAADYARRGGGVLAVMHDLNLTANFADTVLVMKSGRRHAHGTVSEVFTSNVLSAAFDHPVKVNAPPANTRIPFVLPVT